MKKTFSLLIISLFLCYHAIAQWTNKTMQFGGLTRQYRVYKPTIYNPSNPAALLIALHGLGDNMTNFSNAGWKQIADTANVVVIVPQAVSDPFAGTAWNSGAGYMGYYPNASVNDIGFINALVDTARANYAINPAKMYLCGFSMGGFMTQRMALQSNLQFAAFCSMSGTIGNGITNYNPGRKVPIAHFHGTNDATVAFVGNNYGIDADSLINFWVLNNQCSLPPDSMQYPDLASDSITVDCFKYSGTTTDAEVWFFRMNNAGHVILFPPANDIFEPLEMWMFLKRHQNLTAGVVENTNVEKNIYVYPNPASSFINVMLPPTNEKLKVELYSLQGALIYSEEIAGQFLHIPLDRVNATTNGIYILRISGENLSFTQKIIVNR